MDEQQASNGPPKRPIPDDSDAEAERILNENQKHSTSGLSWDEVAKDDQKGWRQTTEMGEGD